MVNLDFRKAWLSFELHVNLMSGRLKIKEFLIGYLVNFKAGLAGQILKKLK
jgi:hypothetical protein